MPDDGALHPLGRLFALASHIHRCQRLRILEGDAAHAIGSHAGQGGSLALEDALVLAGCLAAEKDIGTALAVYEQSRRGRVEEIARMTRRRGATKQPASRLGMFIRDQFVKIFVSLGNKAAERPLNFRLET